MAFSQGRCCPRGWRGQGFHPKEECGLQVVVTAIGRLTCSRLQTKETADGYYDTERRLLSGDDVENLGELKPLKLVPDARPDEALMRTLEGERGRGRDDYPVRAVWNSILAGVVFQHPSLESLRRELLRKAQLRCSLELVVMLAMAPGRIEEKQKQNLPALSVAGIRSLVRAT